MLQEGKWIWDHSGSQIRYDAWYGNEPSNGGQYGQEDCMEIRGTGHLRDEIGKWNDQKCDHHNLPLCQLFS